jgi:FimV-like protein
MVITKLSFLIGGNMRKVIYYCWICLALLALSNKAECAKNSSYHLLYGPIASTDNLYRIAIKLKPNQSVTINQEMLALLRANREAFDIYNVNALKPGSTLNIPNLQLINEYSAKSATSIIDAQNVLWQKLKIKHITKIAKRSKCIKNSHKISLANIRKSAYKKLAISDQKLIEKTLQTAPLSQATPHASLQTTIAPSAQTLSASVNVATNQNSATLNANTQNSLQTLPVQANQLLQEEHMITYMRNQLQAQNQRIKNLEQELLRVKNEHRNFNVIGKYIAKLEEQLGKTGFMIIVGTAIFLCIYVFGLIVRHSRSSRKQLHRNVKGQSLDQVLPGKDEYEFMSGEDSVVAKLNLARAYIDMGNSNAAQEALQDVLAKGSEAQQIEAKELLKKLESK